MFVKPTQEEILRWRYPSPELKAKYKFLNYSLASIMGILIVLKVLSLLYITKIVSTNLPADSSAVNSIVVVIGLAVIALLIYLLVLVCKYDNRTYLLTSLLMLLSLSNLLKSQDLWGLAFVIIVIGLSSYLKLKLFPNIPFFSFTPKK